MAGTCGATATRPAPRPRHSLPARSAKEPMMQIQFPRMLYKGGDPAAQENQLTVSNFAQLKSALAGDAGWRGHPLADEVGAQKTAELREAIDAEDARVAERQARIAEFQGEAEEREKAKAEAAVVAPEPVSAPDGEP